MNDSQPSSSSSALPKPAQNPAALLGSILYFADAHYGRENWLAARDFLILATKIDPEYPRLLGSLGSLQFQLQEYPAACATFSAAVRQSPEDSDLHIQLAMVHLQLKQVEEATAALQRSLSLRINNPIARQMLGDIDFAAKRYADAAQHYRVVLESNPGGVILLLHLGKCHYELGDRAFARWCYERVMTLEPANEIASDALQILTAKAA
jgi:tetratricopeptide (TPR) repeat protein